MINMYVSPVGIFFLNLEKGLLLLKAKNRIFEYFRQQPVKAARSGGGGGKLIENSAANLNRYLTH
jgi:hypothetical protein